MTSSTPKKNQVIKDISDGKYQMVVGTHALIEGKINFRINSLDENGNEMVDIETGETITEEINAVGNIGTLYCHIGDSPAKDMQDALDNMRNG